MERCHRLFSTGIHLHKCIVYIDSNFYVLISVETDFVIYEVEPQMVKVEQTSRLSLPRILSYTVNPIFVDAQETIGERVKELLEKKQ